MTTTTKPGRTQADLCPRLPNTAVTMGTLPTWIAHDNRVLRFYAFYRQSVHESQVEAHRVLAVVLLFYLQDGTVRISEAGRGDNDGLVGGDILGRSRVPLHHTDIVSTEKYLTPDHLAVGHNIAIHGRVYRVVDADDFTRRFYDGTLAPAEPIPSDEFHERRLPRPTWVHEPVSAHYEAVHGRPQPWQLARSRQFLAMDGKVLRWWARWGERRLIVHYFLADDTVEVLDVAEANSGRDHIPSLVKRQRLRKRTPALGIDGIGEDLARRSADYDCYKAGDFIVGATINVFGRDVVLERADAFTKTYFMEQFGVELGDDGEVAVEVKVEEGDGAHEQTEEEAIDAAVTALKRRRNRRVGGTDHRRMAQRAMRFKARQVSTRPEDVAREFVVTFFLADETVAVFENPIRNSGFIAGKVRALNVTMIMADVDSSWSEVSSTIVIVIVCSRQRTSPSERGSDTQLRV